MSIHKDKGSGKIGKIILVVIIRYDRHNLQKIICRGCSNLQP